MILVKTSKIIQIQVNKDLFLLIKYYLKELLFLIYIITKNDFFHVSIKNNFFIFYQY